MSADVPTTLGTRLEALRRRRFVGRASEIELFRAAQAADEPPFAVLYVHGPGGIGKSSLLDAFERAAADASATVVRIDGRAVVATPEGVLEALGGHLDVHGRGPVTAPGERTVVLIDAYERIAVVDGWLRSTLLPRLPGNVLTVIAGRLPPSPEWRSDAGWHELLRVVALRNLTPDESRAYLMADGVPDASHERLLALTHGHPLALSLAADLALRKGELPLDELHADLVGPLLQRLVDALPSQPQRRALEVCAIARTTTEDLLRDALDVDDAHELFAWLAELPFVESNSEGLVPHDLARDVLDVDLRRRDPEAHRDLFRRVRSHIHRRLTSLDGMEQQRAIFDEKFVFRNLPSVLSPVDWNTWGESYPQPAQPTDRDPILEMVAATEGDESAAIAERWWDRQSSAFFTVPDDRGGIRGFLALVTLSAVPSEDLAFDPGAVAAWEHASRTAPARPGEVVTQTRFVVDRELYQAPSPTLNATPILTMQRYLRTPGLSWDFLTLADPDPLNDYFAIADLLRVDGADFVVGDRSYGLFAHDFRRLPVDGWLELVTDRALAQAVPVPPSATAGELLLSQPDFTAAVREALRQLSQPAVLFRNPLIRTPLVLVSVSGSGDDPAATLARLLREAADTLRVDPRDQKRWRAVERTYLRPAETQELAAEALGLPFSTYRRHLAQGVERIVSCLWDWEVYGTGPTTLE